MNKFCLAILLLISCSSFAQMSLTENDYELSLGLDRASIVVEADGSKKFNTFLYLDIKKQAVTNQEFIVVNVGLNNQETHYLSDTLYLASNFKLKT